MYSLQMQAFGELLFPIRRLLCQGPEAGSGEQQGHGRHRPGDRLLYHLPHLLQATRIGRQARSITLLIIQKIVICLTYLSGIATVGQVQVCRVHHRR